MWNLKNKMITLMMGTAMAASFLTGCGEGGSAQDGSLRGNISLAGSTSMEKLCEAMSESFMEANPGVTVTVEYTGSGAGIESLAKGLVDIGNASRQIKAEEKSKGVTENVIARDGIVVVTDKGNPLSNISSETLSDIYSGKFKRWNEIGGPDEAIVVIGREAGSGTREAFEDIIGKKDSCAYALELDSTGAVMAKVASTPGAIGYVSLDVVNNTVNPLNIDGVKPSEEQIQTGAYKLQRPFVMATRGDIAQQNKLVIAWFDYINSAEGKAVIKKVGLIAPQK